ncbi:hypothetical protein HY949_03185 [Candidatus Gottesmanbacteria bacterium]|nr:hypothetical protein [Candidatus Gottesmanbacteria bacterium]
MATINPKVQVTEEIVDTLLTNKERQYTENAHAEIFRRLIATIEKFNKDADRVQRMMLYLAVSQVILAVAQIILAIVQYQ